VAEFPCAWARRRNPFVGAGFLPRICQYFPSKIYGNLSNFSEIPPARTNRAATPPYRNPPNPRGRQMRANAHIGHIPVCSLRTIAWDSFGLRFPVLARARAPAPSVAASIAPSGMRRRPDAFLPRSHARGDRRARRSLVRESGTLTPLPPKAPGNRLRAGRVVRSAAAHPSRSQPANWQSFAGPFSGAWVARRCL